jgi:N-acetylglucosaminyldiphosphoundecaprenol N-acetyl-beta-D-mannosaminyltransferase
MHADLSANTAHLPCLADAGEDGRLRDPHTAANVLGVAVDAVDLDHALDRVQRLLRLRTKGYVCAVSVHGVLEARRDPSVARAFADAAMVVPDGTPMVWVGRLQGKRDMRQVTGPDLMYEIVRRPEFAGLSHFFYGGKQGVALDLALAWMRKVPGTRVAGTYTPPFRDLTAEEESKLIEMLNQTKPDILWVGISTPRQELFMRRILPHLERGVMFGVGAAFDFHTGRVRDCAAWIKRIGFQWLHRLMQDPRRLWRRNLWNATFLWHIALQLTGLKKYGLGWPTAIEDESAGPQPASARSSSSAGGSA